jgi:hypothetical protein
MIELTENTYCLGIWYLQGDDRWIGFDINPQYAELAKERTAQRSLPLSREGNR